MTDLMVEIQAGGDAPAPKPKAPLWRRVLVRAVQVVAAVGLLFHLYALLLAVMPAPSTILMVQRGFAGEDVRRDWTSLDDISPHLVRAVIAAEDAGFCAHGGIDWESIEKAREFNRKHEGKRRRGGSTISQQTAKNVFFWNGGGMARKAGEAWMTLVIETVWGKRRIMEVYLNVAEWGDGVFGAEAAAQERFGKAAADLTKREASLLAAVLPSPNKWSADAPGPYVRKRAGSIRSRMDVVQGEGLAACALDGAEDAAPPAPKPAKGDAPKPRPSLPELPPEPETGDEALVTVDPETVPAPDAEAALDAVLDTADETFGGEVPVTQSVPDSPPQASAGEGPVRLVPDAPAAEPEPAPAEPAPAPQ